MRQITGKRPENIRETFSALMSYMGRHKFLLLLVGILTSVSALANLLGTYMLKPIINNYIVPGDLKGLIFGVAVTAAIYGTGALSALGYTQTMARAAQKIIYDIRRDLFRTMERLPLKYFDTHPHGDIMSRFTNDVDTVSDALNNSFAMIIQSFIQVVGTLVLLFLLNWRLTFLVILGYAAMFLYIRYSTKKSKYYFNQQQEHLGELDGYMEEMIAGQKVVKVFNHETANLKTFRDRNEQLRQAGVKAVSFSGTMIPMVVSISYINYALVAIIGGIMAINGLTDVGSLASYLVFVRQAAMPINQFTQQSNFMLAAMAGAERIFRMMKEQPEEDEGHVILTPAEQTPQGTIKKSIRKTGCWAWEDPRDHSLTLLRGDVRFHDVVFGYTPEENHSPQHQPLRQTRAENRFRRVHRSRKKPPSSISLTASMTFTAAPSPTTALMSERSARIPCGAPWPWCSRTPICFTGTIADNIRFGKLDADMEEIRAAARLANADSFITRLPKKLRHHGYRGRQQSVSGPAPAAGHCPGRGGGSPGADPG